LAPLASLLNTSPCRSSIPHNPEACEMAFEASLVKPFLTGPPLTRSSAEYSQFSPDVVFLFFLPFGLASISSLFKVYPVSLESTYASIPRPGADTASGSSCGVCSAAYKSSMEISLGGTGLPSGLGTAARSLPSVVLRIALVHFSRIPSLNWSWSIDNPARNRGLITRCSLHR
jgi:hypothetical protein